MKRIIFIDNSERQITNILQEVKIQRGISIPISNPKEWQQLSSKLGKISKELSENKEYLKVGTNRYDREGLIILGKGVNLKLEPDGKKTKAIFEKNIFENRKIF